MFATTFSNGTLLPLTDSDDRIFCVADYQTNDLSFKYRARNTFLTINNQRSKVLRECPNIADGRYPRTVDGKMYIALCGYRGLVKAGDSVTCTMQMYAEQGLEPNIVGLDPRLASAYLTGVTSPPLTVSAGNPSNQLSEMRVSIKGVNRKKIGNVAPDNIPLYEGIFHLTLSQDIPTQDYKLCRISIASDSADSNAKYYTNGLRLVNFIDKTELDMTVRFPMVADLKKFTFGVYCVGSEGFAVMTKEPSGAAPQTQEISLDDLSLISQ